jgi:flagellar protein FlaJ
MRPLIIMPYVGAGLLIISTLVLLGFSQTIIASIGRQSLPFSEVVTVLLPPLMVQIFFTGLVTGKLSSGTTAAGFRHAFILTAVALVLVPISKYLMVPFVGGQ